MAIIGRFSKDYDGAIYRIKEAYDTALPVAMEQMKRDDKNAQKREEVRTFKNELGEKLNVSLCANENGRMAFQIGNSFEVQFQPSNSEGETKEPTFYIHGFQATVSVETLKTILQTIATSPEAMTARLTEKSNNRRYDSFDIK